MKKNIVVFSFLLCFLAFPCFAARSGDLDDNGRVDLNDIAYTMAWLQLAKSTDTNNVVVRAKAIYPVSNGLIVRLPDPAYDDFDGDGLVGMKDIAIMMAFFLKGGSNSFEVVKQSATLLYPSVGNVDKLPGAALGETSVPITIPGIQVDP